MQPPQLHQNSLVGGRNNALRVLPTTTQSHAYPIQYLATTVQVEVSGSTVRKIGERIPKAKQPNSPRTNMLYSSVLLTAAATLSARAPDAAGGAVSAASPFRGLPHMETPLYTTASEQPLFSDASIARALASGPIDWVAKGAVTPPISQGRCGKNEMHCTAADCFAAPCSSPARIRARVHPSFQECLLPSSSNYLFCFFSSSFSALASFLGRVWV